MLISEMSLSRFMSSHISGLAFDCKFFGKKCFKPYFQWRRAAKMSGCPSVDLLYLLARTGPVVPAHPGYDQEQM